MEKPELLNYLLENVRSENLRNQELFWNLLYAIKDVDEGKISENLWKGVVEKVKSGKTYQAQNSNNSFR